MVKEYAVLFIRSCCNGVPIENQENFKPNNNRLYKPQHNLCFVKET